jgi:four helix bundle protein
LVVDVDLDVDFDGDGDGDLAGERAIEFLALVYEIVAELPRGHAARADQLMRSAESTVRNIAEGAGRWSDADSANRYTSARGEAMESAASSM